MYLFRAFFSLAFDNFNRNRSRHIAAGFSRSHSRRFAGAAHCGFNGNAFDIFDCVSFYSPDSRRKCETAFRGWFIMDGFNALVRVRFGNFNFELFTRANAGRLRYFTRRIDDVRTRVYDFRTVFCGEISRNEN